MSNFIFDYLGKKFNVQGPPGATEAQARAVFDQQSKTGALIGLNPGDVVSAATQATGGVPGAAGVVGQALSGVPGSTIGAIGTAFNTSGKSFVASTGSLSSLAQQAVSKAGGLFGTPVTNSITTADFAKTTAALVPMAGLDTINVRATIASVGKATGQDFSEFTNVGGVGKFGFNATQLETAGLLKPGTASTFLSSGANDLTTVLKSPAVWTGRDGINSLDSLLSNPAAQNLTQQNLMSSGLATAGALGVPINSLKPKDLSGVAANFAKSGPESAAWIKGQLPADKQADFDQRWKNAQFAVGSADSKFNDAMLQQAPPGEATDTVDRATLTGAVSRVFGNDKIPPINYDGPPQPPTALIAEFRRLNTLSKEQQTKLADLGAQDATAKNADALIAQYDAIRKYLDKLVKDFESLKKDLLAQPYTYELTSEVDTALAIVLGVISDISKLFIPSLRKFKAS
jgi:hypothetical protein